MPQDSDTGEKSEEPTGKKLSDAVSKGNIAKSADINTAALLAVALLLLSLLGGVIWESLQGYLIHIYRDLGNLTMTTGSLQTFLAEFLDLLAENVMPFMLGVMFVGVLAAGSQVKFQFSPQAIEWNLNKFNPPSVVISFLFSGTIQI